MSQTKRPPARPHSPTYIWMSEHYDDLFADGEPVNGEWLREQAIKHKLTDLTGRLPSDSNLRQTLHRVRKAHAKRKTAPAPAPAVVVIPEYRPIEPPPRRPYAVVNPVRIETAPVTTEKPAMKPTKF